MDTFPVDQRLLHAILDFPENSLPDLVRFAAQNHENDLMDLDPLLIDLFRSLHAAVALPFFMRVMRDNPSDVPDELVESIVELGAPAVAPVLQLLGELEGKDAGDVPFVLAALRVRDPAHFGRFDAPDRKRSARRRAVPGNVWRPGGHSCARSRAGQNTS